MITYIFNTKEIYKKIVICKSNKGIPVIRFKSFGQCPSVYDVLG